MEAGSEETNAPLEWQLVQVVGLESPLEPTPQMLAIDPDVQPMLVNGLKGWALTWLPEEEKYLVKTFNGCHICISAANLQGFEPGSVDQGGFDLACPAEGMPLDPFAESMASKLVMQHFCVVQFSTSAAQAREALKKAKSPEYDWACMPTDFEAMFMGRKPQGKISWLADDTYDGSADPISFADMAMEEVALALAPYCPELGFVAAGKSNGMLRMPTTPADHDRDLLYAEGGSMTGDDFKSYADFTRRGKISLMYFLHGSGGTLTLEPKDASKQSTDVLIEEGQMVIFDQELMNFSYSPHGSDALVLHSWILREAFPGESGAEGAVVKEQLDTLEAPVAPVIGKSGETVDCMAMGTRFIGNCWNAQDTNSAFMHGCDAMTSPAMCRWDHSEYYDPEGGEFKISCNHIGMCCNPVDVFTVFDNEYWGMTEKEAQNTNFCARTCTEVAMESCVRAGFTRESLRGSEFVLALGAADTSEVFFNCLMPSHITWKKPQLDDEVFLNNRSTGQHSLFLSWKLGLTGPAYVLETACSTGLYATAMCHADMRPQEPGEFKFQGKKQVKNGIAAAVMATISPWFTMSLCKAGMLTHMGRCFTFDSSADGFVRSEACAAMFLQAHVNECPTRYALLAGTAMNQDGRSASLTAPNGVSQQQCIRLSLREAGIRALDIQIQELHGTGTPLGDPIEVGALRNTMMEENGVIRKTPLVKTSSKANFGHGELAAGLCGIMKCVLMGMWATANPGCHIRLLNPNIDANGYPVLFASESVDQGTNWGYFGVSSFGFSGCNARGDVWASASAGPRKALPIGWNLTANRHVAYSAYNKVEDKFACEQIKNASNYEERWSGTFQLGNAVTDWTQLHIAGTWSKWAEMEAPFSEDAGVYTWAFRIGDTLSEEFRIHVNQLSDLVICPAVKQTASPETLILGPGQAPKGYNWRVDGRKDGAKVGDMYVVKFWHDAFEKKNKISWHPATADLVQELAIPFPEHRYYIWGSFNGWSLQELQRVGNSYQTSIHINKSGVEDFQFCRDRDLRQLIYPSMSTVQKTDLPIHGPNHLGQGKHWGIKGKLGEVVTVKLGVDAGKISVSIISSASELTWKSLEKAEAAQYSLAWDDPSIVTPMAPDAESEGVYRATVKTSSDDQVQWFRILVDGDQNAVLHPEMNGAMSGCSAVVGPDMLELTECPHWRLDSLPDEVITITLDFNQAERRSIVTWASVGPQKA